MDLSVDDLPPPPGVGEAPNRAPAQESAPAPLTVDDLPPPPKAAVESLPPPPARSLSELNQENERLKTQTQGVELDNKPFKTVPEELTPAQKKTMDAYTGVRAELGKGIEIAGAAPKAALKVLQLPVNAVAGGFERVKEALGEVASENTLRAVYPERTPDRSYARALIQGFADPELIRKVRIEDAQTGAGTLTRAFHEVFPPLLPGLDVGSKELDEIARQVVPWDLGPFVAANAKLFVSIYGDPLMSSAVLSKTPKGLEAERALAKGRNVVSKEAPISNEFLNGNLFTESQGLGYDVEQGHRALFQLTVPGTNTPLVSIKGQKAVNFIERQLVNLEMRTQGLRKLSQRTGYEAFDSLRNLHSVESVGADLKIKEVESVVGQEKIPAHVNEYIRVRSEFPENAGPMLRAKGISLTPEEAAQADRIQRQLTEVHDFSANYATQNGVRFNIFEGAVTPEERARVLSNLERKGIKVPSLIIDNENFTFSESRGFGRRLTEDAIKARAHVLKAEQEFVSQIPSGLKTSADSTRARTPLSTEVFEDVLAQKYGKLPDGKTYFNRDVVQTALQNSQDLLRAGRDMKFLKTTKTMYGRSPEEWGQLIARARQEEVLARSAGKAVPRETMMFARLRDQDLVPINNKVWNQLKARFGLDDQVVFQEQRLLYPRPIADAIEQQFYTPDLNAVEQSINWAMRAWSKSVLTNVPRVTKQFNENHFVFLQHRGNMADLMEATRQSMPFVKRDRIGQIFDQLPIRESVFDASVGPRGRVRVSPQMLSDEHLNFPVDKYLSTFHEASKEGKLDALIESYKQMPAYREWVRKGGKVVGGVLKAPYAIINENPLAKVIRHFGSSADNLYREAYFRQLIKEGYSVPAATQKVAKTYLDFRVTSNSLKRMRIYSPFVSYNMKNMERLIPLLLARPGVTNIVNPYDGYLKRAIEDYSGWSPNQTRFLQKIIGPLYPNDIVFGPFLRGAPQVLKHKDAIKNWLEMYVGAGLTDPQKASMKEGFQFMLTLPSNLSSTMQFLSPFEMEQNLGPLVKGGIIMGLGYDWLRDKPMDWANSDQGGEFYARLTRAAQEVNPYNMSKFTNGVLRPALDRLVPTWREHIKNLGRSNGAADLAAEILVGRNKLQELRIDDATIKAMTQYKFFGLGQLTKRDLQYHIHQQALIKDLDAMLGPVLNNAIYRTDKKLAIEVGKAAKRIADQIRMNTRAYTDINARELALHNSVEGKESQIYMQLQAEDDEAFDGREGEDAPDPAQEQVDLQDAENGHNREPQSINDTELFARNSAIIQSHLGHRLDEKAREDATPKLTVDDLPPPPSQEETDTVGAVVHVPDEELPEQGQLAQATRAQEPPYDWERGIYSGFDLKNRMISLDAIMSKIAVQIPDGEDYTALPEKEREIFEAFDSELMALEKKLNLKVETYEDGSADLVPLGQDDGADPGEE